MGEKNINVHIGNRLRMRRTTLGLSQTAIANEVGIAPQQVQKYEKGTNSMNAERLVEFAGFLKVPVAYFFDGFDDGKPNSRSKKRFDIAANDSGFDDEGSASDRETIEILKSFKRIKDHAIRKRMADLLRSISLKDI
jgi:transcriptional regulator with XRE-family HTH domain